MYLSISNVDWFSLEVFLEECKYVVKEKKMSNYITDDIITSDDCDRENSDYSDEGNSNE